ncbi:MAG: cell division protein FtsH [Chlamydiae bacterium RIFCSPHIGHO2_12_FULL_44_59]|nr:MAG: cell division protein FtsH [Chlamydiae bacterium RIFCSPHIGHO2_01_FULL_44_39]OGN60690.1 MAG: cell division protein FtsH [Chlamydiae bacterium RIFCSPHIGHO2_12_FULL_44_59]OGN66950.1 MAG: cell division protein FtsH [Chlamydiae bacterium RIFCSPLOWO2_01_FULL_44_52]OGN67501.1 MAG: cell division protein FtsH [Chlamydiae bacterium RIFCSPLOWO2_02_FULL_45_22]OGN71203.1 MAG: cell division protein FtsH [Chlamydiae bacterium RIFCSPLOWO2_12_FULL_45_20]
MNQSKVFMVKMRSNPKKSFPGGFFLFIAAAIFIIIGVQTLTSSASGKVSFSHQAEHLTNLGLIVPEENKKIAQNDNLVTFSGRFRETRSDESYDKYRYLELLNENHHLKGSQALLASDIGLLEKNVSDSADLYLHLSGQTIPRAGFVVVGPLYDSPERNSAIILHSLTDREVVSLPFVERSLGLAQSSQTIEAIGTCGKELRDLLALLRSPALGVGSESLKQELKQLDQLLSQANDYSPELQLRTYRNSLNQLSALIGNLGRETDGVRLSSLRSVRNYVEEVQEYNEVAHALESNAVFLDKARAKVVNQIWFFNNQELSTRALEKQDSEIFSHWFAQASEEWAQFDDNKGLNYRAPDQPRNTVLEKKFKSQEPSPNYFSYILTILPVMLVILFLYFIFSRQMKGVGSSAMNFGKSPARLMTKETNKVTFKDVAGAEEAKEELAEIVDFLRDPQKFTALGARIPKGVLLVGPPGTGKTLVAKAVAGEADRPFFSISGSDFVEMFVGVGASRIRDMFDTAKKSAPCIIFMDEIDAVGRHRGAGIGGGHDEREQTLNQLLVEMDGFDTKEGVILMAATNRPDILDRALLRPGRFDRRVVLDLPDVKGRFEILKVHARKIKMDGSVDLSDIAKSTPGASGADLENILNEAALLAARKGRSAVTAAEVIEASDKVRYGKERRSLEMDKNEKLTTAYHESGHAMTGLVVQFSDPVDKVTIIPRGFSLGATHFMPQKNRLSYWKREVLDKLVVLMGGRAAEELFVKDMSSGAQHDIMQATKIARSMVCEWGMSDSLGTVTYDEKTEQGQYLGMAGYHERNYSEETAEAIDKEVRKLIDEAHKRALNILEEHKEQVKLMTDMLMEFETLDSTDIKAIMDGTWNIEAKKSRVKLQDELQMNVPPPPPVPIHVPKPIINPAPGA